MTFALSKIVVAFVLTGSIVCAWGINTTASCDGEFTRPAYKSRGYYCSPGQMVRDAYDPSKEVVCEEMEVDHLISLRQAWESGICGDDLKRLANDPRNLKFTHWRTNRLKGYLQPEVFAKTRSLQVAEMVIRDAEAVRQAYPIKSHDQIYVDRMLDYATNGAPHVPFPVASLSKGVRTGILYKQVGGRTVAFVGKRAVGYAIGVGATVEVVMAAGWAADWLTSPSQDERMRERAEYLMAVLEGEK